MTRDGSGFPPRLLDLFCGAGGAAMGYHRAGFDVVGVDIRPQPNYPFPFIQADAMTFPLEFDDFDLIHASPPCQAYSRANRLRDAQGSKAAPLALDLIEPLRDRLVDRGLPYVIENVPGAPLLYPVTLCGSMFGLEDEGRQLRRHRGFESSEYLTAPGPCQHRGKPLGVYHVPNDSIPHGGQTVRDLAQGKRLMGIDWMTWDELKESLPPVYTEHIGRALIDSLERAA